MEAWSGVKTLSFMLPEPASVSYWFQTGLIGGGVLRFLSIRWYQMIPSPAAIMSEAPDIMANVGGSEKTNQPINIAHKTVMYSKGAMT